MIVVGACVWIDYFRGRASPRTDRLDAALGIEPVAIGDIILTEVLQGFGTEGGFAQARRLLGALDRIDICGPEMAVEAARNVRRLRARGMTPRKITAALIATCCIQSGLPLLYEDREFDPFVAHLGLASALG